MADAPLFLYLEGIKSHTRFAIISYNKDTKYAKLRGQFGGEFEKDISKESLARLGYKVVRSPTELPLGLIPTEMKLEKKARGARADDPAIEDDDEAPPPPPKKTKKTAPVVAEEE